MKLMYICTTFHYTNNTMAYKKFSTSAYPPPFVRLVSTTNKGTNQYAYKLLQSHKSQNTLYMNTVEW